ncbi:MAG: hypothetical protein E6J76_13525 [Deltaproteobacteria bacterium]|nr:MAG: hypothetical protein E6J76_13525 [Deltaproteobacteria bacterium]
MPPEVDDERADRVPVERHLRRRRVAGSDHRRERLQGIVAVHLLFHGESALGHPRDRAGCRERDEGLPAAEERRHQHRSRDRRRDRHRRSGPTRHPFEGAPHRGNGAPVGPGERNEVGRDRGDPEERRQHDQRGGKAVATSP